MIGSPLGIDKRDLLVIMHINASKGFFKEPFALLISKGRSPNDNITRLPA